MIYQPSFWPYPTHGRGKTILDVTDNLYVSNPLTVVVTTCIQTLAQNEYEICGTPVIYDMNVVMDFVPMDGFS